MYAFVTKPIEFAKRLWRRLGDEFEHAPMGFSAAVATLIDLGFRVFFGHDAVLVSPVTHAPASGNLPLTIPGPLSLLELALFEVLIGFISEWIIEKAARFGLGLALVALLFAALLAAYFTTANAFVLARFLIETEGYSTDAFAVACGFGALIVVILMAVILWERYESKGWNVWLPIMISRLAPFCVVAFFAMIFFGGLFSARITAIVNDVTIHKYLNKTN